CGCAEAGGVSVSAGLMNPMAPIPRNGVTGAAFAAATALALGLMLLATPSHAQAAPATAAPVVSAAENNSIRPFRINIAEADLVELRRRIAATRWPDKETVADQSPGAQLAKLQELCRYWGSGYDRREIEAKLNGLP